MIVTFQPAAGPPIEIDTDRDAAIIANHRDTLTVTAFVADGVLAWRQAQALVEMVAVAIASIQVLAAESRRVGEHAAARFMEAKLLEAIIKKAGPMETWIHAADQPTAPGE